MTNELKCIKFTEGLSHPELKRLAHRFLTEEKRRSVDVTIDVLVDHCNGLISGNRSLGERARPRNGRAFVNDDSGAGASGAGGSGEGGRKKRKPKGDKKRRAEEQSGVESRAKKGKPTDKDGKPLAGEALQRKQEYDSMAKKLGKAKILLMPL
eukprot:jgi/Tetstr1/455292/TSEL_042128.t1